jgi:hypothetical protein
MPWTKRLLNRGAERPAVPVYVQGCTELGQPVGDSAARESHFRDFCVRDQFFASHWNTGCFVFWLNPEKQDFVAESCKSGNDLIGEGDNLCPHLFT